MQEEMENVNICVREGVSDLTSLQKNAQAQVGLLAKTTERLKKN